MSRLALAARRSRSRNAEHGPETRARTLPCGRRPALAGALAIAALTLYLAGLGCSSDVSDSGANLPETRQDAAAEVAPTPDVADDTAPECERAEDCGAASGPCHDFTCDKGRCVEVRRGDDLPCDDGDPCTSGTTCRDTICGGGTRLDCDDDDPCTEDLCSETGECKYTPLTDEPCDDGDVCTLGDTCRDGVCRPGAPVDCDDQNLCTDDTCNEAGCVHSFNTAACDDGDPCTLVDFCADGLCTGSPNPCDDDDDCTIDSCQPGVGCRHTPDPTCIVCTEDAECADAVDCTVDTCGEGGVCERDGSACPCQPGDDAPCADGNGCTSDVCTLGYECRHDALADGVACSDFDPCTEGDACEAGVCVPGAYICPEVDCANGLDDDADGMTDCDDSDCTACGETDCTNGIDDEGDGATDCADAECAEWPSCWQQCTATTTATCGQEVNGSTNAAADDVTFYPDCSPTRRDGGEFIYEFEVPIATALEVRLVAEPPAGGLSLVVLEAACDSASCVAEGDATVQQALAAGVTYYVVVDSAAGAAGDFTLEFDCGETEFLCGDTYDNDFDDLVDCDDPDCAAGPLCDVEEDCGDDVDDDEDGLTDCVDPDCIGDPGCGPVVEDCGNGSDDDGDTLVDCFDFSGDSNCLEDPLCAVPCAAPVVAACDRLIDGTTVGAADTIRWYPFCTPGELDGPERVYAVTPPVNVQLRARLVGVVPAGLDVAVLGPDQCGAYECLGLGDTQVTRELTAGRTYYVAVDGPAGGAAAFTLALQCGLSELFCADGADDDEDGATDCADGDCGAAPNCIETVCDDGADDEGDSLVDCHDEDCWSDPVCSCAPTGTIGCDETRAGTTVGATDQMDRYTCAPFALVTAGERIYSWTADRTGSVRAALDSGPDYPLDLFVLEGGCAPQNCIAWGDADVTFEVVEGQTYEIVVDATEGFSAPFQVLLDCGGGPELNCSDGEDDEGDGLADCADPDCAGVAGCLAVCEAAGIPLGCGQTVNLTNEWRNSNLSDYACEGWPETGGEIVFRLVPTVDDEITATLTDGAVDLDLLLLEAACDPDACVDAAADTLVTRVYGGRLYYLVVDGYLPADAGEFQLTLDCGAQLDVEADCAGGTDDDGDGATDCGDPDCWWDPLCAGGICFADTFVSCGQSVPGTTAGAPDTLSTYSCTGDALFGGEAVYRFVAREDGDVTVALANVSGLLEVQVLEDVCGSDRCLDSDPTSVTFAAEAGRSYYVVVDALAGDGTYRLDVSCP